MNVLSLIFTSDFRVCLLSVTPKNPSSDLFSSFFNMKAYHRNI